jgi:hypothetical protein
MTTATKAKKAKESEPSPEVKETAAEPQAVETQPAETTAKRQVCRAQVCGYPATAVLRWMGLNGWKYADARAALNASGAAGISDITIRIQLLAGKKGERGEPAAINKSEAKELAAAAKKAGGGA